jgi:hypothetical protein
VKLIVTRLAIQLISGKAGNVTVNGKLKIIQETEEPGNHPADRINNFQCSCVKPETDKGLMLHSSGSRRSFCGQKVKCWMDTRNLLPQTIQKRRPRAEVNIKTGMIIQAHNVRWARPSITLE